jgi:hypothetical protein
MNESSHNQNESMVDEDIARMRNDLKMGRFTLDFEGMESMTILQRTEFVRHGLYEERGKLPENAKRLVNDITLESDRMDFFPNVHLICEKMIASSDKRFEQAKSAFTSALNNSNVRPGKKAVSIRRTIDAKYDSAVVKQLAEERKKIDAQKKAMEKYIKMAPQSSYAAMMVDILKQNEESYQLTSQYLSAQATVGKYEAYEKSGVLTEEEKKLCTLAKEMEQASQLKLTNHKQNSYLMQERDAFLRLDNKKLMMQAHKGLLNCAKDSLAFIEIPKEMTERLLEHGLMAKEKKYYEALQAKQDLKGFHPFKKMAIHRELQKTAKEYNEGLALLSDTRENKLKHPPLTTLEEWKKQNSIPVEKMEYGDDEIACEIPVETFIEEKNDVSQVVQLDLSEKIHTRKIENEPVVKKEEEKVIPDIQKEI